MTRFDARCREHERPLHGHQLDGRRAELTRYLMTGEDGRCAARRVDGQIRKLPGFGGVQLLEAFAERALAA